MSSLVINGNTSGSITLAAPAVAGSPVLTLPTVTGTLLSTTSPKSGNVLQVVNATYSTATTTSSLSYVDTGLSATITPSSASSKVLVFANIPDAHNNVSGSILYLNIVRASTQIIEFVKHGDYIGTANSLVTYGGSTSYLDSPNTTSATTYKVQFKVQSNSQSVFLNTSTGTITLMEIAA